MKKKIYILIIACLLIAAGTGAQTVFHSLGDVWQYADQHNISILSSQFDLQKSGYSKKSAYSTLIPQLSVSAGATENTALQTTLIPAQLLGGPEGMYKAVQFGQKYIYNGGYSAQWNILNVQNWMNAKIATQNEELSRDSLANTRKSVYQQLASQYYNYLLMKEAARLAQQSADIADSVSASVQHKFSEGLVNEANVDVAKINAERARQTFITSQYQALTSANNLKALLDMSLKDSIVIDDALDKNVEMLTDAPFSEDPSLVIARKQVQLGRYQLQSVNSSFLPSLSITYSNSSQQNDNKFEPFKASGPHWYPARYWNLSAGWTLFNGGGSYFQSRRSKLILEQKEMLYENSCRQADINDENLRLAYKKAVALTGNSKKVMELSMDNYRHISRRYAEGLSSIDDRLNAFSDFINYQNQYLNNLSDLLVQMYTIKTRQFTFK